MTAPSSLPEGAAPYVRHVPSLRPVGGGWVADCSCSPAPLYRGPYEARAIRAVDRHVDAALAPPEAETSVGPRPRPRGRGSGDFWLWFLIGWLLSDSA